MPMPNHLSQFYLAICTDSWSYHVHIFSFILIQMVEWKGHWFYNQKALLQIPAVQLTKEVNFIFKVFI